MRKIHRLDLDFAKDIRTQRKITFKEQDSITLYISIYNDGVPVMLDGQIPRLFVKKSDGTILYQTEVLEIQNNVVAFDVHRQATTCPGLCYAEVEFIEGKEDNEEELVTTRNFVYLVEPKVGSIKDAIASVDEAYFLKAVEDFIKQAKIDIAEFRDAVASLEDRVIEADEKLEQLNKDLAQADLDLREAKEEALEEISDLRYETIDDIQEARDEGIDTITILNNETVQIIDQIKNNSINLIIDEKDNSIKAMAGFKDDCLNAIELLKNGTVTMIYQAKNDSINEINDTSDRHLNTIRNNAMQGKADIINLTKSSKEEIEVLTNTSIEAIESLVSDSKTELDNLSTEYLESFIESIESLLPYIEEGNTLRNSLLELQNNLSIMKDSLSELYGNASLLKEELTNTTDIARTVNNELLTSKDEASNIKVALDQIIATTESLKDVLLAENERAEANIEELNTLHPEADIRIETLRNLIEEAKRYEEVVRVWIANREPAEDLTEVNRQLEELYRAVELLDVKFNNYYTKEETYTKEEVNELIGNIEIPSVEGFVDKEYVDEKYNELHLEIDELKANSGNDTGFKGSIGLATKFASLATIRHYDNAPEPPVIEGSEYIGKVMYSYLNANNYLMYRLVYLYDNPVKGYYPYLYVDTNETSEVYIRDKNVSKSMGTSRMYEKRVDAAADSAFTEVSSMGIIYDERAKTVFYHSDVAIYSDVNKSGIYREASGGEFISNLDLANVEGKYYVNVKKEDYKTLQNMPDVKLSKDLETVLHCSMKDDRIIQEITIEGITYTRAVGEQWSGLNTSNFVKKDVIANIEGLSANTYSDAEGIFASCPKPNVHQDIVGEIDFRADVNKYYRVYTTKKTGNEMFYQTISSNGNSDIGYTKNRYYYIRYVYQNNVWSEDTSTYQYASCKAGYTEIYRNTLPVCKGTGTTTFDKNTIIKEATTGAEKKVINDFNLATTYGVYNIDVKERETVLNAPIELLSGVLECVVAEGNITQRVSADNGDIYTRYFNGSKWTEWKKEAELPEGLDDFMIPFEGKINTHTYTNGDGMPETYNWVNLNGLKVMWINVKHSEAEYNSGVNGLMMKTLNFPEQAQVFNQIIMANITSYCRSSNNTLSRIVQNAEIISNVSVRGRWRHTDNVPPSIDNFTIMCVGF